MDLIILNAFHNKFVYSLVLIFIQHPLILDPVLFPKLYQIKIELAYMLLSTFYMKTLRTILEITLNTISMKYLAINT